MGFHRLLTHRGYKTPKAVEYFLTFCGLLALEGGAINWVVTHRIHHANTDETGDPHTPRDGRWWAHMGWILRGTAQQHEDECHAAIRAGPDEGSGSRLDEPFYFVPLILSGIALFAIGGWSLLFVGCVPASHYRFALHLAGKFSDAPVGHSPLSNTRRLNQ